MAVYVGAGVLVTVGVIVGVIASGKKLIGLLILDKLISVSLLSIEISGVLV